MFQSGLRQRCTRGRRAVAPRKLWSYTENRYPPPAPYPAPDPFEPFAIAAVESRRGNHRAGQGVEGTLAANLKVGMEMELTTMTLFTELTASSASSMPGGSHS